MIGFEGSVVTEHIRYGYVYGSEGMTAKVEKRPSALVCWWRRHISHKEVPVVCDIVGYRKPVYPGGQR